MNSRKLVNFFFKTLFLGGIAGLITSFFVKTGEYSKNLNPVDFMELLGLVLFFIGLGMVFAVVSQTGFFAYLYINRFGLGFFRSYWPLVQVLLIAFVVFDLIYFPYQATKGEVSVFWYILMAAAILGYGWIIAKIKAKETEKHAFVPALFLMVVITAIEWVPGLRTEGTDYAWLMIITLLTCNTYQLLALHRINNKDSGKDANKANTKKA
ncbi:KinB-signaling pathway activation protein [Virgibacillus indicus]|uniref:KinB-signaling pathway activation protein n=1 Tax=Virgibacillus indicus TaxID=2024554 RepID=A0A265N667_9BACI|nr:KinB-signaling pathway activation protein [Virgibacillus indicus]OZU87291.1 KinB-signaling pathway activation protein [Virgibacillus indicus]